jgi:hypothetical protein
MADVLDCIADCRRAPFISEGLLDLNGCGLYNTYFRTSKPAGVVKIKVEA